MSEVSCSKAWIQQPWIQYLGQPAPQLEQQVAEQVGARIAAKKYSLNDCKVIAQLNLNPVRHSLALSKERLERLRQLCQLFDVQLKPSAQISSHRPIIGPMIVAAKRALYPLLSVFLRDTLRQQRAFNAMTVTLLIEALNEAQGDKEER
jgi:hypothetical protein